jgi:iron-sulfur cluster assembly accessory protein
MIVTLTNEAKEQMNNMLKETKKPAVRLSMKGGGCAGMTYDWTMADAIEDKDEVIDLDHGKFCIDTLSQMYLIGSTIHYKKEVFGSFFDISNPATKNSCGCGESVGF